MKVNELKIGSLIRFSNIYNGCHLNGRTALYLGETIYVGPDGTKYVNYSVHVVGEPLAYTVDKGILTQQYMEIISEGG